jgi:sugar (pentulose or hexulose) kinase
VSILGVDLGTSGVRAVAFAHDGRVLDAASERLELHRAAPGRVELDPSELLGAVESVVARVAAEATARQDPPRALAFAVLGEAVLPVGADGEPLARIAVSMDTRGEHAARTLGERLGAARFTAITGQPLHGMFSAFKVAAGGRGWEDAAGYRCVGDYVTEHWTGRAVIDFSQAARTGLFDIDRGQWSDDIIDALAVDAPWLRRSALPDPVAGGRIAGSLTAEVAARLGLAEGLPVVAGAHDQAAAYLGGGGTVNKNSVIVFGSSDCVTVGTADRPHGLADTGFATYRVDDRLWVTLAGTAAGGWALEWFAALVGGTVGEVFGHLAPEPPSLLVLPYFAGSGTLDNDPDARGVFHGLTLETTIPELARAVVEGAGFEFAKIIDAFAARGITVGTLRVSGTGAQNSAALRARADATGASLTPVTKDASARGAAILAARGAGLDAPGLEAAPGATETTQQPDPQTRRWYDEQRRRYRALYEATRSITLRPFEADSPAHEKEITT